MQFYEVAPFKIIRSTSTVFTYHSETPIPTGSIVHVQVGTKTLSAIVWKQVKKPSYATKPIGQILIDQPLPKPLLKTAEWMSEYYSTHLANVLQTILPAGLEKKRRAGKTDASNPIARERTNFLLNEEQRSALDIITNSDNKTVLLHGVTGAGKTAVYIDFARKLLDTGKSVIILTPEISLTPQLAAEMTQHFENVLVTHSKLTSAERHVQWQSVLKADKPMVIIGPRSALFMPLKNLGAILIDECHEPSFKQEQQPRYTASRVAKILAVSHGATLVLGSATPSVADYYMAEKYGRIASIRERAKSKERPIVTVIDATKREWFSRHPLLSTELIEKMAKTLATQKQVLLFHNRRGTASSTLCEKCGWHAACDTCMLPLTLHADEDRLRCHVCGQTSDIPPHCPMCGKPDVIFKGIGTKRLEVEVQKLFSKARIARFDADALKGETLHEQYQAVYDGDIDIIIGTQLIAKGLDLPRLGLVGIPQADAGLLLPDFGARERTFQLVSQACGRVGRQLHATDVIVQTYYPNDPVIASAVHEDYETFYRNEINERNRARYPPFTHLLKLVCAYKTEAGAVRAARELARELRVSNVSAEVIGPTPAFYERLRGMYRWQITLKSNSRESLQQAAKTAPKNWQVELDPHSLLS